MNIVILQWTARRGWVLTYNGNYIRSWTKEDNASYSNEPILNRALNWIARNPEGWSGDVQVQIIGTLESITGSE